MGPIVTAFFAQGRRHTGFTRDSISGLVFTISSYGTDLPRIFDPFHCGTTNITFTTRGRGFPLKDGELQGRGHAQNIDNFEHLTRTRFGRLTRKAAEVLEIITKNAIEYQY